MESQIKTRPTSITVISWILIVIGSISLLSTTLMINNPAVREAMSKSPIPVPIQYAMSYAGLLVIITCGIAMLNGRKWGRLLYVGWSVLSLLVGFATSPMKAMLVPGLFVFLLIVFFLFRPRANAFFAGVPPDAQSV